MKNLLYNSPFPFTLQCCYDDTSTLASFEKLLLTLSQLGFYGIELNLPNLQAMPHTVLKELLNKYGLKITYIATGAYAKLNQLSLSSADQQVRRTSVDGCKKNIDYAANINCGIIIGFLKGETVKVPQNSEGYLKQSLAEIVEYANQKNVAVLLEATNRYEACVANSVEDAVRIAQSIQKGNIKVLPDTYHMNIEESNPFETLKENISHFTNIHFSDNNRLFPGYGFIDFAAYSKKLAELGYNGTIGIEGNIKTTLLQDIEYTAEYLHKIFSLA